MPCPKCGEAEFPDGKFVKTEIPLNLTLPIRLKIDQMVDVKIFFRIRFPVKIDLEKTFSLSGTAVVEVCFKCGFKKLSFPSILPVQV